MPFFPADDGFPASRPISMPSMPLPPNFLEMSLPSGAIAVSRPMAAKAVPPKPSVHGSGKAMAFEPPRDPILAPFFEVRPSRSASARGWTRGCPCRRLRRASGKRRGRKPSRNREKRRPGAISRCFRGWEGRSRGVHGKTPFACFDRRMTAAAEKVFPLYCHSGGIDFPLQTLGQMQIRDSLSRIFRDFVCTGDAPCAWRAGRVWFRAFPRQSPFCP